MRPEPAQNVFVTRLHVRYDRDHFPEDLVFQETGDRQNYQGRYVIRHPWKGATSCDATHTGPTVRERQEREAQMLANLTGWNIDDIRGKDPLSSTECVPSPTSALVETPLAVTRSPQTRQNARCA